MKNKKIIKYIAFILTSFLLGAILSLSIKPFFTHKHTTNLITSKVYNIKNSIKTKYYEKLEEKKWGADFEKYLQEITKK